jgi:hypothetical protein
MVGIPREGSLFVCVCMCMCVCVPVHVCLCACVCACVWMNWSVWIPCLEQENYAKKRLSMSSTQMYVYVICTHVLVYAWLHHLCTWCAHEVRETILKNDITGCVCKKFVSVCMCINMYLYISLSIHTQSLTHSHVCVHTFTCWFRGSCLLKNLHNFRGHLLLNATGNWCVSSHKYFTCLWFCRPCLPKNRNSMMRHFVLLLAKCPRPFQYSDLKHQE